MKKEPPLAKNPPPITPIRGRILGRLELLFVRDRKSAGGHRRLVARYALPGDRRDVEIFAPAIDAAWRTACRVSKRERNKQRREELGNERAAKIQKRLEVEDRRKRAAEYRPDLNLTIKREWLDAILFYGKAEEYRALSCKQVARLWQDCLSLGHFPHRLVVAVFRAGYTMDSRAIAVVVEGLSRREFDPMAKWRDGDDETGRRAEWGEPCEKHYALRLGRILCSGLYSDVKDKLGRRLFVEGSNHA